MRRVSTQSVPKRGRDPDENEDAVATDPTAGWFAVADGVSRSARSDVWSRLLVDGWVATSGHVLEPEPLAQLARQWVMETTDDDLPWYAVEKLAQGSSATLVGLHLERSRHCYTAQAVGDSCLLHVRRTALVRSFPLQHSSEFNHVPRQIRTDSPLTPEPETLQANFVDGDVLVLASDALACFLLRVHETRGELSVVHDLANRRGVFDDWVDVHRRGGQLANDDTTICVIRT